MEKHGQVVAIVPRSFCNGPYYKPFRRLILRQCSLERIHVFESRNRAFKDDDVLQENVIVKLIKGNGQGDVIVSCSHDQQFSDYAERSVPFSEIVKPSDREAFIHVPTEKQDSAGLPEGVTYVRTSDLGRVLQMSGDLIRHHLRCGNLPEPKRRDGKGRLFTRADVERHKNWRTANEKERTSVARQ